MDQIELEFFRKGYTHFGVTAYPLDTACKVIDRCKELGAWIFGVDSLLLLRNEIQPFLEYSSDYSNEDKKTDVWTKAKDFIISANRTNPEFVFEIVYDDSRLRRVTLE